MHPEEGPRATVGVSATFQQPMFSQQIKQDYHSDQHESVSYYQFQSEQDPYSFQQLFMNQPSSQQRLLDGQNTVVRQPQQFPGFSTTQIPTSAGPFDGMIKDEQGRWMMKSAFNWNAWFLGISGIILFPLLIGIPLLILAIFSGSIDFTFDDEKSELIVHRYGGFIRFGCLDAEFSISYDNIKDVEVKADFSFKVNDVPNGIMFLVTMDGQRIQLTTGYTKYNSAVYKKNKILSIIRRRF